MNIEAELGLCPWAKRINPFVLWETSQAEARVFPETFSFPYPPTVIPESPTLIYISQLVTDWNDLFLCLSLTLD